MQVQESVAEPAPLAKPEGGYVQISAYTMGLLWWSFSEGLIGLRAVRVGLALLEARIRRNAFIWTEKKAGRGAPKFTSHYTPFELATLCGLPEKRVRSALAELRTLGLLAEFSPDTIRFARSLEELTLSEERRSAFRSWLPTLTKRRRVPVPRRALVLACESSSKALVAVVLGVCARCCWLRPDEGFTLSGRVSCSWLSRRFNVSIRAVENAKAHLVSLGWMERTGNINRFGEVVAINPAWHRLIALAESDPCPAKLAAEVLPPRPGGTNSAGVADRSGANSAGVSLNESPLNGEIQNPRRESPPESTPEKAGPGIFNSKQGIKTQDPSANSLPPPRLSAICAADFRETGRALELFRQAVICGLMPNASEFSRLQWLAAIERARTVPARNPAGVFLHVVKGRKWDYLSDGHYDAANARLKKWLNAPPPGSVPFLVPRLSVPSAEPRRLSTPCSSSPPLSKDAQLIRILTEKLGERGHVFAALAGHAGWDRERYSAAVAELEGKSPPIFQHGV